MASRGQASSRAHSAKAATTSRDETAAYIADLIAELRDMAEKAELRSVCHWLDRALAEMPDQRR